VSPAGFFDDPERSGLFLDFDGTLSEIVDRPQDARPLPGIPQVLQGLGERFAAVCVVSGRSAYQLSDWLGPGVEIWGLHGAQHAIGGRIKQSPLVAPYMDLIKQVKSEAEAGVAELNLPGVIVEDKQAMVGLHWRAAEDRHSADIALRTLADRLAQKHGLIQAEGKLALELRPPVDLSKRAVIIERSLELRLQAVAFAGDDLVDLPAFDALDALEKEGLKVLRVAVESDEAPVELLERADRTIGGPKGMLVWLQDLLSESGGVAGSSPA
jgi:trehalose 6-phosphate phosphatase